MNTTSRPRPLRAWWLAARPKTLSGALVPVISGAALAFVTTHGEVPILLHGRAPIAALLCGLFAALMQIASNFINDLIDFRRGDDRDDRLGPERACAQGWISPRAMTWGIAVACAYAAVLFTATLFPTPLWKLGLGLLFFAAFFAGHALSSRQFAQMPAGREMNRMLGITSSNMLRFAMVTVAVLLLLEA